MQASGAFRVPLLRLHYERIKRRWTQAELGRRARIQQTIISAIERGRVNPTEDELLHLANALSITPPSVLMQPTVLPDEAAAEALTSSREVAVR
jgi:transcriptional regulator with XRE-family HTH domain